MTPQCDSTTTSRRGRGETGSVTLWGLGMVMILFFVGWITFDLYAATSARRTLAAAADQAAQAGANALDATTFRATGIRQLDPAVAEQNAIDNLTSQHLRGVTNSSVYADRTQIHVTLDTDIDVGLLRLFADDTPIHISVTAIGTPKPSEVTP